MALGQVVKGSHGLRCLTVAPCYTVAGPWDHTWCEAVRGVQDARDVEEQVQVAVLLGHPLCRGLPVRAAWFRFCKAKCPCRTGPTLWQMHDCATSERLVAGGCLA